jgi:hypothetical protein
MPSLPSALLRLPLLIVPLLFAPLLMTPTGATAAALDDVVTEFLGGTVQTGLPTGFPVVAVPAGLQLRVVGTLAVSGVEQVLLETPDTRAASTALRSAYVAAGWTDLSTSSIVVLLCHATHGSLQIMPSSRVPGRLRVLRSHDNIFAGDPVLGSADCGRPAQSSSNAWSAWFLEQLPVLSVPPQTRPVSTSMVTSSRVPSLVTIRATPPYGALELTVSAVQKNVIEVPNIDIAGLDAHFSARLREQGWTRDSGGSGQRSATSVWYRSATMTEGTATEGKEVVLAGTLTLQNLHDLEFYINFDLQGRIEVPASSSLSFVSGSVPSACAPANDPLRGDLLVTGSRICRP